MEWQTKYDTLDTFVFDQPYDLLVEKGGIGRGEDGERCWIVSYGCSDTGTG